MKNILYAIGWGTILFCLIVLVINNYPHEPDEIDVMGKSGFLEFYTFPHNVTSDIDIWVRWNMSEVDWEENPGMME